MNSLRNLTALTIASFSLMNLGSVSHRDEKIYSRLNAPAIPSSWKSPEKIENYDFNVRKKILTVYDYPIEGLIIEIAKKSEDEFEFCYEMNEETTSTVIEAYYDAGRIGDLTIKNCPVKNWRTYLSDENKDGNPDEITFKMSFMNYIDIIEIFSKEDDKADGYRKDKKNEEHKTNVRIFYNKP